MTFSLMDAGKCAADDTNYNQGSGDNNSEDNGVIAVVENSGKSRSLSCRIVPVNPDMDMANVIQKGYCTFVISYLVDFLEFDPEIKLLFFFGFI